MKTSKEAVQAKIKGRTKEERGKIARWKICKGKPFGNMRYVIRKMYMSIVLNLNERKLLQLLSNIRIKMLITNNITVKRKHYT